MNICKNYLYILLPVIVLLLSFSNSTAQTAVAPSGSGTSGDPYLIATLDNLYWITQSTSRWNKHYKQTADIDASSTNTWDGGAGFTPIGNISTKFTGTYDGNGKTLTGLFINRPSGQQVGLFGRASTSAEIINVGLINVNIAGGGSVGGLVGFAEGDISNSYSTGSVSGTDYNVGGLVGYNWSSASIANSYSTSSVIGKGQVGGLAGNHKGIISNSYSTGSVSKSSSGGLAGGLVGASGGTSTNSFWDTQTSGRSISFSGTGKTTAEMKTLSTFLDAGWDFELETTNGTDNFWDMDNVNQSVNNGYPFLSWQNGVSTSVSLGDNIAHAFNLGDFHVGASNQNKKVSNNTSSFTDLYSTSPGNDVFYKFNIIDDATDPGKIGVYVRTTGAAFNSVIYLLDASGNQVAANDGSGNNSLVADYTGTFPAGTYYVVVDGSSAAQAGSFTVTVEVVKKVVAAKFTANPEIGCSTPHTVFFTDQSTNPDIWSWNFGDGGTSTAKNPIHTYTASGTFVVTLEIQDTILWGAKSTFTDTIYVSNPIADFSGSPLFGCGPLTVNFTDASVDAVGWEWTFGDGNTSTAQNPTHIYSAPGTYTVTLKVASSLGCTNTKTRTSYVQVIGPNVDFGITSTSGSVPLTVSFKDLSTSGSPITSWSWDFGDGSTSSAQNPTHIYNTAGMYNVSLTVEDLDGCPRTSTKNNFVNTPPTVTINQASGQGDPSNSSTINFTVVFNEAVTGFATGDITLSGTANATTGTVTEIAPNDGTTYNVAITGMTNDGTVITSITAGVATDNGSADNIASTSTDNSVTYDATPPTIIISTISGDDRINGMEDNSSLTISGTTSGVENGQSVTVGLNGKTYNGTVNTNVWSVMVPAADVQALNASETVTADVSDLAGNAATQATKNITYDAVPPTITINTIAVDNRINAIEDDSDITISGTTSGAENGRILTVGLNGKTYTDIVNSNAWSITVPAADIQALNASETVTADVSDLAGNAATQSTKNITYDTVAPTITINTIAGDDIINATEDNSNVTISGTTSGAEDGQSVIVGLNGKTYNGTVSSNAWSVTVPAADAQALNTSETVTADVSDLAGNPATQAAKNITHDITVPIITIGAPSLSSTTDSPVIYKVTYTDANSINLTPADVTLNTTGTATGRITVTNGTASNPAITINKISGDGKISVSIKPGTSVNAAGNADTGAGPSETFSVDNSEPAGYSVTINQSIINSLNSDSLSFVLTGAETGTVYEYTIRGSGEEENRTGNVQSATQTFEAIDVSGLPDGKLTLSLTLTDALDNKGEAALAEVMKDTMMPDGYAASIDQEFINVANKENISFTVTNAELKSVYNYAIKDTAGNVINGTGTVSLTDFQIENLDLTNLADGEIELSISLTDTAENAGSPVVDKKQKDTKAPDAFEVSIDQDVINLSNSKLVSFTIKKAAPGMKYNCSFRTEGSEAAIVDSGIVDAEVFRLKDINLSSLNDGNVTLKVVLTDQSGNSSSVKTDSRIKDVVAPTVEISSPSRQLTISQPVTYGVTYKGADEISLTPEDVVLNKTGTADGTISVENGNLNNPIVGISNISGWGTINISIKASTSGDRAGNKDVGAGMSKLVNVNDVPELSLAENTITYVEGTDSINIAADAMFDDDSPEFDGGLLTAEITGGKTDNDRLWLDSGNWIVLSEADILYENIKVGTYNGGVDGVTIRLNSNSNAESVQQIIRNLVYTNLSNSPADLTRTIEISFDDNDEETEVVSAGVFVNIRTVNNPPVFANQNEYTVAEDSLFTIALEAVDPEDGALTYSAEPMDENATIVSRVENSFLLSFAENWSGRTAIIVTAADGELITIDTIYISVEAVNDPPRIVTPLSSLEYREDEPIVLNYTELYQFVNDPDNADSTLLFSFNYSGEHFTITGITDSNITILPLENWFGIDTVTVIVSDGELSTRALLDFSILSVNDLPEFIGLADTIKACGSESIQLDMWEIVNDVETPDELLNFEFTSSSDTLEVVYDETTGLLNLSTPGSFGGKIDLTIKVTDSDSGRISASTVYSTCVITSLDALDGLIPENYVLEQNYPNPFNPTTTIRYGVPEESRVQIMIYNILGELVTTLTDEIRKAGYYEDVFNAGRMSSGIYFFSIYSESTMSKKKYSMVKKMMLIK